MALVKCPHCYNQVVPDTKGTCPLCGSPMDDIKLSQRRESMVQPVHAQRIENPKELDAVRCPKCGSTQIQAMKKGFGFGKAAVGAWVAGPVGLLAGGIGAGKVQRVCLKCGKKF